VSKVVASIDREIKFYFMMLTKTLICTAFFCAALAVASDSEFSAYSPQPEGSYLFLETFQDLEHESTGKFVKSEIEKYANQPVSIKADTGGFEGDMVMNLDEPARHYGLTAPLGKPARTGDSIVMQYEARFADGLDCGGAYVKMLAEETLPNLANVDEQTPYIIMFGPDKCGTTKKIHLILRHKNPVSGEWEEKHLKNPPSWTPQSSVQLFTLVISSDDSFSILVNSKEVASGSLMEDFDPPVNPAKMIDDPEDEKPGDWVDEAEIKDPEASKPDDWDEDAPAQIKDPAASMPEGWLEGEELMVPDPSAEAPGDWDEEEDGEWEAPVVSNPKCSVGCGPWTHPMIANPEFKGKWSAPLIVNPAYIGEWAPKQIENPNFFEVANVAAALEPMTAVAVEIWTMSGNMAFDNFLVTNNIEVASDFAEMTSSVKVEMHKEAKEAEISARKQAKLDAMLDGSIGGYVQYAVSSAAENPLIAVGAFACVMVVVVLVFMKVCANCCSGERQVAQQSTRLPADSAKATKEVAEDETSAPEADTPTQTEKEDEEPAEVPEEVVGDKTEAKPDSSQKLRKRRSKRAPRAE
jgi:calnexin